MIVIAGSCAGIRHFLRPIRCREAVLNAMTKGRPHKVQPIVIICPEDPKKSADEFAELDDEHMEGVYYHRGNVDGRHLVRCNVQEASRVVVMSRTMQSLPDEEVELEDAEVVFTVLRVKQFLRAVQRGRAVTNDVFVVAEFDHQSAIRYLHESTGAQNREAPFPSTFGGRLSMRPTWVCCN